MNDYLQQSEAKLVELARALFLTDPRVKFVYVFGSVAKKETTTLSDIDFGVYLDGRLDRFTYRLNLMRKLAHVLKTENFDLVILNNAPLLMKYEVMAHGVLLKDNPSRRMLFETDVLRQYLDTEYLRRVQLSYIKEKIRQGKYFG